MKISDVFIQRPVYSWLLILICLIGGLWALTDIGRLEDPAFTIKEARVFTLYPGASAQRVEEEVTEKLEVAIQQMGQLDKVTSTSSPGMSEIRVRIKDQYNSEELAQVWDELRRKVNDAQSELPNGAMRSVVNDDFGEVYGIYYAVTGDGFSQAEMREITKAIHRELLGVEGVAKVSRSGIIDDVAYLDIDESRLAQFGFSLDDLAQVLQGESATQQEGEIGEQDLRTRIVVDNPASDLGAVRNILVGVPGSTAMLAVRDIADVSLGYNGNPDFIARFNGKPAILIGVAGAVDTNIVDVGMAVGAKLAELKQSLPLGVEIHPVYEQHIVVEESVKGFLFNLVSSIVIVTLVLCMFMGWRSGVVVGVVLGLTVLGTVLIMNLFGLNLQRISLGALIIAMGMLVDNAIVVAEGMLMGVQRKEAPQSAAQRVVRQTFWPLLGATIIGIMAFSGIGLSDDATGEFLFSLFAVIGISLVLSWVLAITITPYLGYHLFRPVKTAKSDEDLYSGRFYRMYARALTGALNRRGRTISVLVVVTLLSYIGFGFVKQGFFPNSNAPLFYVNYFLPQGSDIKRTESALQKATEFMLAQDEVISVTAVAGRGADRFMLTYASEPPNSAYGQLIVRTENREQIAGLIQRARTALRDTQPEALITFKRLVFGPGGGADVEVRISGQDFNTLRALAEEVEQLFRENDLEDIRHNWRSRAPTVRVHLDPERARVAGVTNTDISRTIQFATSGYRVGEFESGDRIIPIVARMPEEDRNRVGSLPDRLVWSPNEQGYIPAGQLVKEFETTAEESLIQRRNRVPTITISAEAPEGVTAMAAFSRIQKGVESLSLPAGYAVAFGGEYESSSDAQESLGKKLPLGFLVMVLVSVLLFGTVREPLIIWLVVPMSLVGVVVGLLLTGLPFGFMSLLGVLSLSGMLIKNAVVLVDEIEVQTEMGLPRLTAIQSASVSRLRPVFLAAVTTILGMSPLLFDAFFADMAVTIMGGLGFATVLTLIAVPVFYAVFHRVKPTEVTADEEYSRRDLQRQPCTEPVSA
ncbi:efflux RND transporter permease subunit [Microbulbifer sp. 2205BS26-8]|uniref:efflux RND transporter permease subunit n=1 Tax=Microbulbifer sp. 2205BS26-8 TaxID=3064386 RepID=UPI00273EAAE6|nr:efflux RND transporter permease subunit [Microbulbifer sp. 2205BS26-8]MDP5208688.1 efflux RND transporter permease subunit [Microbulbifer sp. 2205BS26-8]